jgi:arginine deiminase
MEDMMGKEKSKKKDKKLEKKEKKNKQEKKEKKEKKGKKDKKKKSLNQPLPNSLQDRLPTMMHHPGLWRSPPKLPLSLRPNHHHPSITPRS